MNPADVERLIVSIPDYPTPGVTFKDLTPIFADGPAFAAVIDAFARYVEDADCTHIAGIEARGFIIGAALAHRLGLGFIPVRKRGKLPRETFTAEYSLEYGTDAIEVHKDSLRSGDRVLVVDDVLATGGTAGAAIDVIGQSGAQVIALAVLLELGFLGGRERLHQEHGTTSIYSYLS